MTDVVITYIDGQVVRNEIKNLEIAQVFVEGIVKSHQAVGILHEIKDITTHEGLTINLVYPPLSAEVK